MKAAKKILLYFEEFVGGTALLVMTFFVFYNVFSRLFFKKSVAAFDELSYFLFAYVIFMGSSSLYKRYGHGVIDLIVKLFPRWLQAAISVAISVLLLFTNGLILVLSTGYCVQAWTRRTQTLHIPNSFRAFSMVLAFAFMLVHSIFHLKNVIQKKDYFHKIPIYKDIYVVDSLEDMVQDTREQQEGGAES